MAIKAVLTDDEFGELDEATKALYVEGADGGYVIDVDGVDDHPTVRSLKSGHQRSKQERDEAKRKAQAFERRFGKLAEVSDDIDLSDVDEERLAALLPYLSGEQELPGKGDAKPKNGEGVDLDKIKANARKPLERDLADVTKERDQLQSQLRSLVTDNALSDAISEIKVAGPYGKAVKAMFRDKVKIVDDEGSPVAMIEGEYGEQPVGKYLKEWAQTDEGKAFIRAENNGGGGGGSNCSRGGKVKNPWSKEDFNLTEQARVLREQGRDVAQRMAAEHGRTVQ